MTNTGRDDPTDEEVDRFFATLAQLPGGSEAASRGTSSADALRDAVRDEADILRQAKDASMIDAPAQELAVLSAMKQRLMADGVLGRPQATTGSGAAADSCSGWAARIGAWLDPQRNLPWLRPAGVALGAVLVGVVALRVVLPAHDGDDVVRGGPSSANVVVVADPAARAQALAEQLRAAGAEVVVSPISAKESVLTVNVPDPGRNVAVRKLLGDLGLHVADAPPYKIMIRARP